MEKLRVDNGVRTIEVNDAGEYLEIHLGDIDFLNRFSSLFQWAEEEEKKYEKMEADFSAKYAGQDINSPASVCEHVAMYLGACEEACAKMDEVFGEGCCRKVFPGVEKPDMTLIMEFLDQIIPLINEMAKEYKDGVVQRHSKRRERVTDFAFETEMKERPYISTNKMS